MFIMEMYVAVIHVVEYFCALVAFVKLYHLPPFTIEWFLTVCGWELFELIVDSINVLINVILLWEPLITQRTAEWLLSSMALQVSVVFLLTPNWFITLSADMLFYLLVNNFNMSLEVPLWGKGLVAYGAVWLFLLDIISIILPLVYSCHPAQHFSFLKCAKCNYFYHPRQRSRL